MDGFYFADHWFAFVLLGGAACLGVWLIASWQRQKAWSRPIVLPAAAFALAGIGGLALAPSWGLWIGLGALAVLFTMALIVVVTSRWWAPVAFAATAAAFLGLGGAATPTISRGLIEAG